MLKARAGAKYRTKSNCISWLIYSHLLVDKSNDRRMFFMLKRIKSLSFNARLVISMNLIVATLMLVMVGIASFKINKRIDLEFEEKMDLEIAFYTSVLDKAEGNVAGIISSFNQLAVKKTGLDSVEVKKDGVSLGSLGEASEKMHIRKGTSSKGYEIILAMREAKLSKAKINEILQLSVWALGGMLLFSLVLYFVSKKFIRPLGAVVEVLSDSTVATMDHASRLKEMSSSVQSSGSIINSGSESTTASMEQLSTTVAQSVAELNKCVQLASGVNTKADQGAGVMNRLVNSMEVIEEANKKLNELGSIFEEISSKTSVINDIVFKTQLLSFNASIEAARAGQHGRGFSVVAEEIGNLAQMSGTSATEIGSLLSSSEDHVKNIISGTDEKIAEGRSVSLEALQSFEDIRHDIDEITTSIRGVTNSSEGQEQAIKSTLDTMINMKETVQEQGIYTRSIGKSAQAIDEQAQDLKRAEKRVSDLIFGSGKLPREQMKQTKKAALSLVRKMKGKKAA